MKKIVVLFTLLFACAGASFGQISGTNAIINAETGLSIRPFEARTSDGNKIVMFKSIEWKCMTWSFESLGGNTYALKNVFTGKTFRPVQPAKAGQTLEQTPYNTSDASTHWEFIPSGGNYKIRLKGTELYLTSANNRSSNAALTLEESTDSKLQLWKLKAQSPDM